MEFTPPGQVPPRFDSTSIAPTSSVASRRPDNSFESFEVSRVRIRLVEDEAIPSNTESVSTGEGRKSSRHHILAINNSD